MALNKPVFIQRTISAIFFVIIMLAGLLWNDWAFLALISLVQVLCLRDFFRIVKKINVTTHWPQWLPSVVQAFGLSLLWLVFFSSEKALWPLLLFFPAILILATTLSKKNDWQSGFESLFGISYIVLPIVLLLYMHNISMLLPIFLLAMIWTNDTMAYIVGSFIGRRPFSPISPNKTWEGTIGGAVLTIVAAGIWGTFCPYYSPADWMAIALCAAVAGTAGDLLESKLKRLANVKDSGTLMPGHGGALDRFDSLLVATPFAFCYAYFFMPPIAIALF